MKKAFITGITGQDGSYLAEFLLEKGYQVYGTIRRVALEDQEIRKWRIKHLLDKLTLFTCDIRDYPRVYQIINQIKPDEIYHLASQSFVAESFEDPFQTFNTNINGTLNILESIRQINPKIKFYFAASSEMFGKVCEEPQTEKTPFNPQSPYAISKCTGFYLTKHYREAHRLFACSGILYNHESLRRGKEFVTRKIIDSIKKIKKGELKELKLGNIEAKRDWGYAPEMVRAMWLILQQDIPDDYIIATNESHSVKEFVEEAFSIAKLDWKKYVKIDKTLFRPTDVYTLKGDFSKAEKKLGWKPKVKFKELIKIMMGEK